MTPRAKSVDPSDLSPEEVNILTMEGRRTTWQGKLTYEDLSPFEWPDGADSVVLDGNVVVEQPSPGAPETPRHFLLWTRGTVVTRAQYDEVTGG